MGVSRRMLAPLAAAAVLGMTGCAVLPGIFGASGGAEAWAARATIVRDEWGVPTIYGPDDATVVFGLAWAQAEDNYWQIEEDYIHALGRAAGYYGEDYLAADLVKAALRTEQLSREEYAREPAERRVLWDAFAAGLNHYMRVRGVQPRVITRWEPWMFMARFRSMGAGSVVDGVRLGSVSTLAGPGEPVTAVGTLDEMPEVAPEEPWRAAGSNMWAVAPGRTESGAALLFQNPHVDFFGSGQRYEMQVHSDAGWHVRGFAILGTPMPRSGHNERLAWSHTNSDADRADVYAVTFDHPTDPLQYRWNDGWRRAEEWADTLWLNTSSGMTQRVFRFRRTHHGPIVAMDSAGRALAVSISRMEEGGSLQQWYAMGRAQSLDEFRAALDQRALNLSNTMMADVDGNIFYLHGNAVPVRDAAYDWTRPVDGTTSRTDWRGYHPIAELPQVLNPPNGWIQNTNATPWLAAGEHSPDAAAFPRYMAPAPDNLRARTSRAILASDSTWTLDEMAEAAFDTRVLAAEDEIPALVREWEEIGGTNPERAAMLDEALDALRAWDRIGTVESEAMTLYILWQDRLRSLRDGDYRRFRALEEAVASLRRDFGRALVPWGEVNRLQRVHTSGREPFTLEAPSLPVPGGPGWSGVIFAFYTDPGPAGRRFGTMGHSWVSVVELTAIPRSRSVVTFGQTADPASPHWFDQAPLYASGRLKQAWFTREDVAAHARRSYRPGGTE